VRIALVGPAHPDKGGGARHTTELAHHLAAAGHDVVIVSWRAQYPKRLYPGQQTVDVAEGAPYPRTRRLLAWYRPDGWPAVGGRVRTADLVVFALLTPIQVPAYLAIMAGLARGAGQHGVGQHAPRTAVICHNVLPHERRPGDVPLVRALLSGADTVITHSAAQAGQAKALVPGARVRTVAMPPHLPTAPRQNHETVRAADPAPGQRLPGGTRCSPGGTQRPPGTRQTPMAPAPPATCRLLFFGIVRRYKGLDVLLRALARAPAHVTLTVAGEFWTDITETEYLIAELGLRDRVTLRPGYLPADRIPALFAAADALVLPYREATASQNALLAFAHGVPVITTTAGALAEAVHDGVDGLTCAPGDADDLLRALVRISDPRVAGRLRAAVPAVDPERGWAAYLQVLLTRQAGPPSRWPARLRPRPCRRRS
jgi:glycosyltransferase involved in cell wall biosynthesis